MAVMATLEGFPAALSWSYLALRSGLKPHATSAGHVERTADDGFSASDKGASGVSSGLPAHGCKASECGCGLLIEFVQFGYLDKECAGSNV